MRFRLLIPLLFLAATAQAQPFRSDWMNDPEQIITFVEQAAEFWQDSYDAERGGYYTNVARDGSVLRAWGTNKDMLTQSRHAYGFSRAFMLTGDPKYLEWARRALDWQYEHAWDPQYGGWFNDLSETGSPRQPDADKGAFFQHYALLGPAAMYEATRDTADWRWIQRGYDHLERYFWDDRSEFFGYYDHTGRDGSDPGGKSFNATVDAATTHLISLFLNDPEQEWDYRYRLLQIGENIRDHFLGNMDAQAIGFAEKFDADWNVIPSERLTIMGHVLKAAWVQARLVPFCFDEYDARKPADHVLAKGYDHEYGGPYKDYDRVTGQMQLWGQPDSAKAWWQMEQAVTAGLELYRITAEPRYLEMADETLDFFEDHFVDPIYGEVYENQRRRGGEIWGLHKGNGFKAGYHSMELGYYTYLYTKLFVLGEPVTLHYQIEPVHYDRSVNWQPLTQQLCILTSEPAGEPVLGNTAVQVEQVMLDGEPYAYIPYWSESHRLPANVGGHFAVTYRAATVGGDTEAEARPQAALSASYPNPFRQHTRLTLQVTEPQHVRVEVLDVLGRQVAVLHEGIVNAATPVPLLFDASALNLPSGMYIVRAEGAAFAVQRRVTYVR